MLFFRLNGSYPTSKREANPLFTDSQLTSLAQLYYGNRQITLLNIAVRHTQERQIMCPLNQRKQIKNFLLNLLWLHFQHPLPYLIFANTSWNLA